MGCTGSSEEQEPKNIKLERLIRDNKPVPVPIIEDIKKSICKIIIRKEETESKEKEETTGRKKEEENGTGFFIDINSCKYLITCYHVIKNAINNNFIIEIWDNNIFNLKFNSSNII